LGWRQHQHLAGSHRKHGGGVAAARSGAAALNGISIAIKRSAASWRSDISMASLAAYIAYQRENQWQRNVAHRKYGGINVSSAAWHRGGGGMAAAKAAIALKAS